MRAKNPLGRLRLLLAMLPPLVAGILQWIAWPYIRPFIWFLFYPAVFFSSWIGGLPGGLAATVISTTLVWYFFILPEFSFAGKDPRTLPSVVLFMGMGALFSIFHGRLRKANEQAAVALAASSSASDQLRQRAEELQEARTRLASVLESIGEGVVVADRDGKFTVFNPAAERILGLGATPTGPDEWPETYGVFLPDRVTPFPAEEQPLARAIRGESSNDIEIHIRNPRVPAGTSISVSGSPIRAADGSIRGGVVVFRDVTEHKRAEEAREESERVLAQRSVQLESANQELGAFAYSVSHDLRAPLRAIDGFSQVLLEDHGERLEDPGRDALGRIRAAAARMARLIDDMLKLSRVTRADLQRARVDLSEMARGVASELVRREPGRRVEIRIADGVLVVGDPSLLRLVLENLLDNSLKFTSKTEEARVEFGVEQQNGGPVYYVRDNGAGFDAAYAGKLFGAFQRLHSEAEFPGTGIGLATVQRIVHRHGGRVWAEGAVDGGAIFRFTL